MKEKLNELFNLYSQEFKKYNRYNHYLILVRTTIFILFIALLFATIQIDFLKNSFIYLFLILLFLFVGICIYHQNINHFVNQYSQMIDVIQCYFYRINGEWKTFKDKGEDFKGNHYLYDLDIIGDNSLFQYLCIAKSQGGRKKLFQKLTCQGIEHLNDRQDTILELNENIDFCIKFEEMMSREMKKDLHSQIQSMNIKTSTHFIEFILFSLLSIVSLISGVLAFFQVIEAPIFIMIALILLTLSLIYNLIYHNEFRNVETYIQGFSLLDEIYCFIDSYTFKGKILNDIVSSIHNGRQSIHAIKRIDDLVSFRKNFLGYIIANSLFPLNSYILYLYHQLNDISLKELDQSLSSLEELEAYISLAVIGVCNENISMPHLSDKIELDFKEIRHPLLKECVDNSFCCENNIVIITGSNMSGKTSFMRTIGMNLVLMYAGTYVQASCFKAPYLNIFTSMRVKDDIDKGISTFYGELLRIKDMIDYQETPFIGFIDEIFKGTNYNDRIFGAEAVIQKLSKEHVILFISTHDFELCDINNPKLVNYYFEESYVNDNICFDYKIKAGKCKTTNARYLMGRLGIL